MNKENALLTAVSQQSAIKDAGLTDVVTGFRDITSFDFTDPKSQQELSELFAHYLAKVKIQAARFDRRDFEVYRYLATISAPGVFQDGISQNKFPDLTSPIKEIRHPLYAMARTVQDMAPGYVSLKDAGTLFDPDFIPQNTVPVIIEYRPDNKYLKAPSVARVPMLLHGAPGTPGFVEGNTLLAERVVSILKNLDDITTLEINHLPTVISKAKDIVKIKAGFKILDWPFMYTGGRLESPLVSAIYGTPGAGEDVTGFESITISSGEISRKFIGARPGPIFRYMEMDHRTWTWWSYKNTIYTMRNLAIENVLRETKTLSTDILSQRGLNQDPVRAAKLSVHVPILTAAAFVQTVSRGLEESFTQRNEWQAADDRRRSDESSMFFG